MTSTEKISIYSSSVISYEQKGKEIWFRIQIIPVKEPCYSVNRRYEDFIHLSKLLKENFPQYVGKKNKKSTKQYRSSFHNKNNNNSNSNNNNNNKIEPLKDERSSQRITIHHDSSSLSLSSKPITNLLYQLPKISPLPIIALKSPFFDHFILHYFFNVKKRQKQLDDYLYQLFTMPIEIHQSPYLFDFLNYRPFSFHSPLSIIKHYHSKNHGVNDNDSNNKYNNNDPINSYKIVEEIKEEIEGKKEDDHKEERYSKSLPPSPNQSIHTNQQYSPSPSPSSPATTITMITKSYTTSQLHNTIQQQRQSIMNLSSKVNIPTSISTASCSLLKDITISLYIGSNTYITVQYPRNELNLTLLKRLLNRQLIFEGYETLPIPLVLAYNHITTTDRQGALKTLTLNSKEGWLNSDQQHHTIIDLACSQKIAFFSASSTSISAATTTVTSSSPITDSLSTLDSNHQVITDQQQQQPWKHCNWLDDNIDKVLLIATDKDLAAAIYGKWRRLDHVTLTCLAH
ncbi:unnamed protein product [Cunninghamella blakesleeana]